MQYWSLENLQDYEEVKLLQLDLVELRARGLIEDTILFLEHQPVITRGRGLQFTGTPREKHMPAPAFLPEGIQFFESERGGDLTYHGPGQLVVYPVVKLDGSGAWPHHDVAGFLRKLERALIGVLADYHLQGESRESATGVWVGERKVASLGVAVRKWVTYHGAALNCVNDLKPFHLISPCGFAPEVMTNLQELAEIQVSDWRSRIENLLIQQLGAGSFENLTLQAAREKIDHLLAVPSPPSKLSNSLRVVGSS